MICDSVLLAVAGEEAEVGGGVKEGILLGTHPLRTGKVLQVWRFRTSAGGQTYQVVGQWRTN